MEYWNAGMSKIPSLAGMILDGSCSFINFLINRVLRINDCRSFPEPNIPMFHCSLAQTWYERMKFFGYLC